MEMNWSRSRREFTLFRFALYILYVLHTYNNTTSPNKYTTLIWVNSPFMIRKGGKIPMGVREREKVVVNDEPIWPDKEIEHWFVKWNCWSDLLP